MKKKHPKGWPTKDGRPATVEEIKAYIVEVEAHYTKPTFETSPHFCTGCTAPLEFEPCPVCWTHHYKGQLERLRKLLSENRPAKSTRKATVETCGECGRVFPMHHEKCPKAA